MQSTVYEDNVIQKRTFIDYPLPICIQEFFWNKTSPFVKPKFGKHHEATCVFCQNAHVHNDLKEACKVFDRILIQNFPLDKKNPFYKEILQVPRWHLIQTAFPHIIHYVASVLQHRRDVMDLQQVKQIESKLLYILHWIVMDAAQECAFTDAKLGVFPPHHYYLFPIHSIMLFVYMLAPLIHRVKESDLQSCRLESGLKLWYALWKYRHPDVPCFTTYCKQSLRDMCSINVASSYCCNVESPSSQNRSHEDLKPSTSSNSHSSASFTEKQPPSVRKFEQVATVVTSKNGLTKTSVTEQTMGEHMVIFRLPSLPESDNSNDEQSPAIFSGKSSILELTMGNGNQLQSRSSLPCEQLSVPVDIKHLARHSITHSGVTGVNAITLNSKYVETDATPSMRYHAATYMDVAVLKCLFVAHWPEEGIYWALNFIYRRLQDMSVYAARERKYRHRSKSVPAPKSDGFYQKSFRKKVNQYRIGVPDLKSSFSGYPFKAFVKEFSFSSNLENNMTNKTTKFLSRSEKNMRSAQTNEYFRFSPMVRHDTSPDDMKNKSMTHPTTSLAKLVNSTVDHNSTINQMGHLIKGTSMPSLRIGESKARIHHRAADHLHLLNPIITVTQHTPLPSPEFLHPQSSVDSQLSVEYNWSNNYRQESLDRKLVRSSSDCNVSYPGDEPSIDACALGYVSENGDIDVNVVLKAVDSIVQRSKNVCSIQVCEISMQILEILLKMGILSREKHSPEVENIHTENARASDIFIKSVFRIIRHLGCPNYCGDGQKYISNAVLDVLRSRCKYVLFKVKRSCSESFSTFLKAFIQSEPILDIVDFFHALLGFCVDPSSLLSPNQKRNMKSSESLPQGGYNTDFGSCSGHRKNDRGVENYIIAMVFKNLTSRLIEAQVDANLPENMFIQHEVRLLVNYVKEAHGGVFRRVLLSGLLDSAVKPNPALKKRVRTEEAETNNSRERNTAQILSPKSKRKMMSLDTPSIDIAENVASPLQNATLPFFKNANPLSAKSVDLSLKLNSEELLKNPLRSPMSGIVNWFKKEPSFSIDSSQTDVRDLPGETKRRYPLKRQQTLSNKGPQRAISGVSNAFHKARKRVGHRINKLAFKRGKIKDHSMDDALENFFIHTGGSGFENVSKDSEVTPFKMNQVVEIEPLFQGMRRFSFLMDKCHPGSIPDPQMISAILDLPYTPVIARAAFLAECSYFVHCCNRGQWPTWMKLNLPGYRPSVPFSTARSSMAPNTLRRAQLFQKTTAKMFYMWAENIASRLEEMLSADRQLNIRNATANKNAEILPEEEQEDYLENRAFSEKEESCPTVLRIMACSLLLEITTYLRDTYTSLPKTIPIPGKDKPSSMWEKGFPANRRFSTAQSLSIGHSQISAHSLQSVTTDGERKISFAMHETNESDGSSNVAHHSELPAPSPHPEEKRGSRFSISHARPFLLRKNATNATRRSLKSSKGKQDSSHDSESKVVDLKKPKGSLSDKSDTSEMGGSAEDSMLHADEHTSGSPTGSTETDDIPEQMPWIKIVIQLMHSFNYNCCHQNVCHPQCYRRHMRACARLTRSIRKVYGEELSFLEPECFFGNLPKEGKRHNCSSSSFNLAKKTERVESCAKFSSQFGSELLLSYDGKENCAEKLTNEKTTPGENADANSKKNKPPILKYIKGQLGNGYHLPLAALVKAAVILGENQVSDLLPIAWQLLLENDQEVVASAASVFIIGTYKMPVKASQVINNDLRHQNAMMRITAVQRFYALWKHRYQVRPRMEDKSHYTFKLPPPSVEFTLTSPKIGQECVPVVNPPWLPSYDQLTQNKKFVAGEDTPRSFVSSAVRAKPKKASLEIESDTCGNSLEEARRNYFISSVPVTIHSARESNTPLALEDDEQEEDACDLKDHKLAAMFPSCLCAAAIQVVSLLDDPFVSDDGNAVYEVAYQVVWNCLVEDSSLFLRYVMERLTRGNQETMFKILRHLIRFVPRLPQQAAFSLYNSIIGYIMFYVRSSQEKGDKMIGQALSILWMVVHSVHGIMFKDLKQILRKEQCDSAILLTANVPSTKKIIVHGPHEQDKGVLPNQFPVQEDTQFLQIWRESVEYFLDGDSFASDEYFLVDHRTRQIRNLNSYVRDYYFFKKNQCPQLELVKMNKDEALVALQARELRHKFMETGKVMLTWAILKNVDMVVQRVVHLHEELIKLPSFPRKALEADVQLYKGGEIGKQLLGLDVMHKFTWIKLIARMFEAMAGNFAYSADIHLFLQVLNGCLRLRCNDSCILRYVCATYVNAAKQFKNIFASNGYFMIMPSLLEVYANNYHNQLISHAIEYAVKQFYVINRTPFIIQMFGSVSALLGSAKKCAGIANGNCVESKYLFYLLSSLEEKCEDELNIRELVKDYPLKAIDFCYHDESETVAILDFIAVCVTGIAYAADSIRAYQLMVILDAILPPYLKKIQSPFYKYNGKSEIDILNCITVSMRTMIENCEVLSKNYSGPQPSSSPDNRHYSSSKMYTTKIAASYSFPESNTRFGADNRKYKALCDNADPEVLKNNFRSPRDLLLTIAANFLKSCSDRLVELNKRRPSEGKVAELFNTRCFIRLADVAHSLLKVSPYDPETMGCQGLKCYMTVIMPVTDWSQASLKPSLLTILRRIDKIFVKIHKKSSIRKYVDWDAATTLLKGLYNTLSRNQSISVHYPFKSLLNSIQCLITADVGNVGITESLSSSSKAVMAQTPPLQFCSISVRLIALQILATGDIFSLEQICGSSLFHQPPDKLESVAVNLVFPMCLRIGSGGKDSACLSGVDILFALNVVLKMLCPTSFKSSLQIGGNAPKSHSDNIRNSVTLSSQNKDKMCATTPSMYKVAFLGLKILTVCFESDLSQDWHKIAHFVSESYKSNESHEPFWNYLRFLTSYRNPLYNLLLPLIHQKVADQTNNSVEQQLQQTIADQIKGYSNAAARSKVSILSEISFELNQLKEELEIAKFGANRTAFKNNPNHRPSFAATASHVKISETGRDSISSQDGGVNLFSLARKESRREKEAGKNNSDANNGNQSRFCRAKAQSRKTFKFRREKFSSKSETSSVSTPDVTSPTQDEMSELVAQVTESVAQEQPQQKTDDCFLQVEGPSGGSCKMEEDSNSKEEDNSLKTWSPSTGSTAYCDISLSLTTTDNLLRSGGRGISERRSDSTLVTADMGDSFDTDDDLMSELHSQDVGDDDTNSDSDAQTVRNV